MIRDEFISEDSIYIPLTFDYNGGRVVSFKYKILSLVFVLFILLVSTIIIFIVPDIPFLNRLVFLVVFYLFTLFLIRFVVLGEHKYREMLKSIDSMETSENAYWGIYSVDREYPYICHYVNGLRGVFISLQKDVFVGKGDSIVDVHRDALADAYNIAHRNKLDIVHIDYMDSIGKDSRVANARSSLGAVTNTTLRTIMDGLYRNISSSMQDEFATYDVYCFITSDANMDLFKAIRPVVSEFLNGNYVAYKALDILGLSEPCCALFGLDTVSIQDACLRSMGVNTFSRFKPMFIVDESGVIRDILEDGSVEEEDVAINSEVDLFGEVILSAEDTLEY